MNLESLKSYYRNFSLAILIALGPIDIWIPTVFAAKKSPAEAYAACYRSYADRCVGYALRKKVYLREKPEENARVLQELPFAAYVAFTDPIEPVNAPGWLRAEAVSPDRQKAYFAWVRRSDVAMMWDFYRVVACWPVASIDWTENEVGDFPTRSFSVQVDGKGKAATKIRDTDGNSSDVHRRDAVYYAQGIFRVARLSDPSDMLSPTFVLNFPERQVTIDMDVFGKLGSPPFRFHSDEALRDCKEIPIVDVSQFLFSAPSKTNARVRDQGK